VRLLIDADGLIKLHRAGVLSHALRTFACAIPQAVYDEVVVKGRARLHGDADAIGTTLAGTTTILPTESHQDPSEAGLGAGELGILGLLSGDFDSIVVSDDRRFLSVLKAMGVRFLTPADVLTMLWRRGVLTTIEAREALERLRPLIRSAAYWESQQDLLLGAKVDDEK